MFGSNIKPLELTQQQQNDIREIAERQWSIEAKISSDYNDMQLAIERIDLDYLAQVQSEIDLQQLKLNTKALEKAIQDLRHTFMYYKAVTNKLAAEFRKIEDALPENPKKLQEAHFTGDIQTYYKRFKNQFEEEKLISLVAQLEKIQAAILETEKRITASQAKPDDLELMSLDELIENIEKDKLIRAGAELPESITPAAIQKILAELSVDTIAAAANINQLEQIKPVIKVLAEKIQSLNDAIEDNTTDFGYLNDNLIEYQNNLQAIEQAYSNRLTELQLEKFLSDDTVEVPVRKLKGFMEALPEFKGVKSSLNQSFQENLTRIRELYQSYQTIKINPQFDQIAKLEKFIELVNTNGYWRDLVDIGNHFNAMKISHNVENQTLANFSMLTIPGAFQLLSSMLPGLVDVIKSYEKLGNIEQAQRVNKLQLQFQQVLSKLNAYLGYKELFEKLENKLDNLQQQITHNEASLHDFWDLVSNKKFSESIQKDQYFKARFSQLYSQFIDKDAAAFAKKSNELFLKISAQRKRLLGLDDDLPEFIENTQFFNSISQYVTLDILQYKDINLRTFALKRWIDVATAALANHNDVNVAFAITIGINATPVDRLKATFKGLDEATQLKAEALLKLTNKSSYHAKIESSQGSFIPQLGMLRRDLTTEKESLERDTIKDENGKIITIKHIVAAKDGVSKDNDLDAILEHHSVGGLKSALQLDIASELGVTRTFNDFNQRMYDSIATEAEDQKAFDKKADALSAKLEERGKNVESADEEVTKLFSTALNFSAKPEISADEPTIKQRMLEKCKSRVAEYFSTRFPNILPILQKSAEEPAENYATNFNQIHAAFLELNALYVVWESLDRNSTHPDFIRLDILRTGLQRYAEILKVSAAIDQLPAESPILGLKFLEKAKILAEQIPQVSDQDPIFPALEIIHRRVDIANLEMQRKEVRTIYTRKIEHIAQQLQSLTEYLATQDESESKTKLLEAIDQINSWSQAENFIDESNLLTANHYSNVLLNQQLSQIVALATQINAPVELLEAYRTELYDLNVLTQNIIDPESAQQIQAITALKQANYRAHFHKLNKVPQSIILEYHLKHTINLEENDLIKDLNSKLVALNNNRKTLFPTLMSDHDDLFIGMTPQITENRLKKFCRDNLVHVSSDDFKNLLTERTNLLQQLISAIEQNKDSSFVVLDQKNKEQHITLGQLLNDNYPIGNEDLCRVLGVTEFNVVNGLKEEMAAINQLKKMSKVDLIESVISDIQDDWKVAQNTLNPKPKQVATAYESVSFEQLLAMLDNFPEDMQRWINASTDEMQILEQQVQSNVAHYEELFKEISRRMNALADISYSMESSLAILDEFGNQKIADIHPYNDLIEELRSKYHTLPQRSEFDKLLSGDYAARIWRSVACGENFEVLSTELSKLTGLIDLSKVKNTVMDDIRQNVNACLSTAQDILLASRSADISDVLKKDSAFNKTYEQLKRLYLEYRNIVVPCDQAVLDSLAQHLREYDIELNTIKLRELADISVTRCLEQCFELDRDLPEQQPDAKDNLRINSFRKAVERIKQLRTGFLAWDNLDIGLDPVEKLTTVTNLIENNYYKALVDLQISFSKLPERFRKNNAKLITQRAASLVATMLQQLRIIASSYQRLLLANDAQRIQVLIDRLANILKKLNEYKAGQESTFKGFKWLRAKSGGANPAGDHGGWYQEIETGKIGLAKCEKNVAKVMAEKLGGDLLTSATEHAANVSFLQLSDLQDTNEPDHTGKQTYVFSHAAENKTFKGDLWQCAFQHYLNNKLHAEIKEKNPSWTESQIRDAVKERVEAIQPDDRPKRLGSKPKNQKVLREYLDHLIENNPNIRNEFSEIMASSLWVGDFDLHWGNLIVLEDADGKLHLQRIDYGAAFDKLDDGEFEVHPHSHSRHPVGLGPTNHYREYPKSWRISPEMVTAIEGLSNINIDEQVAAWKQELKQIYGVQPLQLFAKRFGLADDLIADDHDQLLENLGNRLQFVLEKRRESLANYAREIQLSLCILDKGSIDVEKVTQFVEMHPKYTQKLLDQGYKSIHFRGEYRGTKLQQLVIESLSAALEKRNDRIETELLQLDDAPVQACKTYLKHFEQGMKALDAILKQKPGFVASFVTQHTDQQLALLNGSLIVKLEKAKENLAKVNANLTNYQVKLEAAKIEASPEQLDTINSKIAKIEIEKNRIAVAQQGLEDKYRWVREQHTSLKQLSEIRNFIETSNLELIRVTKAEKIGDLRQAAYDLQTRVLKFAEIYKLSLPVNENDISESAVKDYRKNKEFIDRLIADLTQLELAISSAKTTIEAKVIQWEQNQAAFVASTIAMNRPEPLQVVEPLQLRYSEVLTATMESDPTIEPQETFDETETLIEKQSMNSRAAASSVMFQPARSHISTMSSEGSALSNFLETHPIELISNKGRNIAISPNVIIERGNDFEVKLPKAYDNQKSTIEFAVRGIIQYLETKFSGPGEKIPKKFEVEHPDKDIRHKVALWLKTQGVEHVFMRDPKKNTLTEYRPKLLDKHEIKQKREALSQIETEKLKPSLGHRSAPAA